MKLNRKKGHKDLWFWCSENPEKEKSDWPEWPKYQELDFEACTYSCFACAEGDHRRTLTTDTDERDHSSLDCDHYPLDWEVKLSSDWCCPCGISGSLFNMWQDATNLEKRSIMAEIIATKEWK